MTLHLVFTPHVIFLPPVLYEHIDWYSPENREFVNIIRSYYFSVVKLFGGDHVLYADERLWEKYYPDSGTMNGSALTEFEMTLQVYNGKCKKPFYAYKSGKYPRYYVDRFEETVTAHRPFGRFGFHKNLVGASAFVDFCSTTFFCAR